MNKANGRRRLEAMVRELAKLGPVLVIDEYSDKPTVRIGSDQRVLRSGDTLGILFGEPNADDLKAAGKLLEAPLQLLTKEEDGRSLHFGIRRGSGIVLVSA